MPEIVTGSVSNPANGPRRSTMGPVAVGAIVVLLFVAVLFAANQNEVVGWIVAFLVAAWLIFAIVALVVIRRGARAVGRKWDDTNANLAARTSGTTVGVIDEEERNHELKLDHSFKIIQVQHGQVTKYMAQDGEEAKDQVNRALETIQITATNARDMINQRRKDRASAGVDGEIVDD
ncbi:MAG: hypothetical protein ACTII7_05185 [Galactobacter sp.]